MRLLRYCGLHCTILSNLNHITRIMQNVANLSAADLLEDAADSLLTHKCQTIPKENLHLPGPDYVDKIWGGSDRNPRVLRALQTLLDNGRLGGTGYVSILPVDQGIEHSAGASFAKNPIYFDPENIVRLAIEGGCNAVASTYGILGAVARKYAHKIPFILKFNHNELLSYPNSHDQIPFASIQNAWNMGCVAVGATVYFGSENSNRQLQEVSEAFSPRPRPGNGYHLVVLRAQWCLHR